jgi:hypothetical protein
MNLAFGEFKHRCDVFGLAQFLSAFGWRTAADFEAEFAQY